MWNPVEFACDLSVNGIFQALADAGDDSSDGVCAFFSFFAESGCESVFEETICLANDQCQYDADGNCPLHLTCLHCLCLKVVPQTERALSMQC